MRANQSFISCYTDDFYTPTLIGRNGIIEEMETDELKINRQVSNEHSSRLLPLVMYYNREIKPVKRLHNMICFDLTNPTFVQYYVPLAQGLGKRADRLSSLSFNRKYLLPIPKDRFRHLNLSIIPSPLCTLVHSRKMF